MPTSTEEIDIAKLLINGRQGRAFRDFDRDMKEWLKANYMHMSKYFYTGTRKKGWARKGHCLYGNGCSSASSRPAVHPLRHQATAFPTGTCQDRDAIALDECM